MPKIAEVNAICGELGKENYFYEPEIITQIQQDGTRQSRVVIRVYMNRENKEVFSQLTQPTFLDTVYLKIKEMYENMYDEEEGMKDDFEVDDSAFGFDLDSNISIIGHFYIFLMTIYKLVEVTEDTTPIIDNKGQIQGHIKYSISFKVIDSVTKEEIQDIEEYDSMSDLIGNYFQITFKVIGAEGLPSKLCTKTYCAYEFYDTKDKSKKKEEKKEEADGGGEGDDGESSTSSDDSNDEHLQTTIEDEPRSKGPKRKKREFKTKIIEDKTQSPVWNFMATHYNLIDEEILARLQSDSIAAGVYGQQDGKEKLLALKN